MTYIISGLGSIPGGTGASSDPYGGIGGGSEAQLAQLVQSGMTFKNPKFETGLINGERYVYVQGSDGAFYKFKMPGTGIGNTPNDAAVSAWFFSVIAKNTIPSAAKVPTTPGYGKLKVNPLNPGITLPGATMRLPTGGGATSNASGSKNTLIVGGVAVLGLLFVLSQRDKKA